LGTALQNAAQQSGAKLRAEGDAGSRITFIDMTTESRQIYARYFNEILLLSCVGILAIVALLAVHFKNARHTAAVLLPLALSVLLVMAGLVAAGERLNLLHIVGLLLIVAVGSNYALFFNPRREAGALPAGLAPSTLLSLLLANASTTIGFGVLAFSTVPVLHALGVTVAPGAILALLLSMVFALHLHIDNDGTD
jgi:predicted exporter